MLSGKDTHEVVKVSGGRVRESVYINPHQRYFEPRITGLHRKLMAAGLRGFPHEVLKVDLRESDRALAVDVAGFVVRRLTAEPPMRDGRAWLKRQLDGIGEKGGA